MGRLQARGEVGIFAYAIISLYPAVQAPGIKGVLKLLNVLGDAVVDLLDDGISLATVNGTVLQREAPVVTAAGEDKTFCTRKGGQSTCV